MKGVEETIEPLSVGWVVVMILEGLVTIVVAGIIVVVGGLSSMK